MYCRSRHTSSFQLAQGCINRHFKLINVNAVQTTESSGTSKGCARPERPVLPLCAVGQTMSKHQTVISLVEITQTDASPSRPHALNAFIKLFPSVKEQYGILVCRLNHDVNYKAVICSTSRWFKSLQFTRGKLMHHGKPFNTGEGVAKYHL